MKLVPYVLMNTATFHHSLEALSLLVPLREDLVLLIMKEIPLYRYGTFTIYFRNWPKKFVVRKLNYKVCIWKTVRIWLIKTSCLSGLKVAFGFIVLWKFVLLTRSTLGTSIVLKRRYSNVVLILYPYMQNTYMYIISINRFVCRPVSVTSGRYKLNMHIISLYFFRNGQQLLLYG